jgi:hypothetical protein
MPDLRIAASAARRSMVAGWASLALHGGVIALAVVFARARTVRTPRRTALTEIEVVDAVAMRLLPVPPQVAPPSPLAEPRALAHNRHGRELPQHTTARASSVKDLLAELTVSYDDPRNFTDRAAKAPRDGDHALHSAALTTGNDRPTQDGLATLQMPGVASGSLARPPRAKHDYRSLHMHAVRQFAGQTIRVLLSIDNRGGVRRVDLLKGVESQLDSRTVAVVRAWEFWPALDELGEPIPGYARWEIKITDETPEAIEAKLEKGHD